MATTVPDRQQTVWQEIHSQQKMHLAAADADDVIRQDTRLEVRCRRKVRPRAARLQQYLQSAWADDCP
jgi:hypothetical protein